MSKKSVPTAHSPIDVRHRLENGLIHLFLFQNKEDEQRILANEYIVTPGQMRDLAFELLKIYEDLGFANKEDGSTGFF
jgi:hypothetical protein